MPVLNSNWSAAWRGVEHQAEFDKLAQYSGKRLHQYWERFNEVNLLRSNAANIQGDDLLGLGCATGEFYRYIRSVLPRFRYHGCDIDERLVNRARQKYPGTPFFESAEDLSNILDRCPKPTVVFNRDVIPFCAEPFVYLQRLLTLPSSTAILRLRTRDHGQTELDPDKSCQLLHGKWIPYMILNVDEMVACITDTRTAKLVHIQKNYEILGGTNFRYLPKECYYPETGTSSTAVLIHFTEHRVTQPTVVVEARPDAAPLGAFSNKWRRALNRIAPANLV
jgi:hypothetical protein